MKKKLVLATALLTVGVATNVKAEEMNSSSESETSQVSQVETEETLKWERDPRQQKVIDDNGNEVLVSMDSQENKITIALPTGWAFWLEKDNINYNPLSINDKKQEEYLKANEIDSNNKTNGEYRIPKAKNTSPKIITYKNEEKDTQQLSAVYNDNQGTSPLLVKITVAPPTFPSTLAVRFKSDDGFLAGSTFFRDSQTIEEKKKKAEIQKQIEEEREPEAQDALIETTVSESRGLLSKGSADSRNQKGTEQQSTADNQNERNNSKQAEIPNSNQETGTSSTDWKTRFSRAWSTFTKYINPVNWFNWWK
ncbi:hypothetical protein ACVR0W_07625 [Streptococcus canis]|uniref:hypothetical protein n=1 Tax=Streptococcus canis TaxID=1329 RepID=UPI0006864A7C|nr:hypothetical protein [Streptococcus canis]MDV5988862.1 hypothetical protein [Streptococcus canis]VEE24492.1 Uncharacterised protein [Streptococcus canis]